MVCGQNIAGRVGMPDNYEKVNELLRADEFSRSRFKEEIAYVVNIPSKLYTLIIRSSLYSLQIPRTQNQICNEQHDDYRST